MTITLNGTTGIQNVLGSAASPAESNTTNSNTGVYFPTSTSVGISTNGTLAMTVDASQNVGVGTSTPTSKLSVNGGSLPTSGSSYSLSLSSALAATRLTTDASSKTSFIGSYYDDTAIEISQGVSSGYVSGMVIGARTATNATVTDAIALYTRSTERGRFHSGGGFSVAGGLGIGTLTAYTSSVYIGGAVLSAGAGTFPLKWNNSSGIVTYDTSSRLVKENIEESPYGLAEVLQLQSRKYKRIDSQLNEIGLVADEVQKVMPEFVPIVEKSFFTKNEADTEMIAGGVNYDKLTSVLVKAIQEQQALITQLTDRIAALEAK